ncbi:hypothetical protein KR093_001130 [Drosophila rubida]|uniref:Exonuclease domain-containing protein n=1 Tax=Drosophila rubida TaxID=30044 RepID=A0AAD4PLM4_9MUSC|nr:hypothetical protein KR093_001130 [Drosophila rubida]
MTQNAPVAGVNSGSRISTFAVLDLETTNLPEFNQNRVSITELCIYAFDSTILKDNNAPEKLTPLGEQPQQSFPEPPPSPRVVHKLNLLFQPSWVVDPNAEIITGGYFGLVLVIIIFMQNITSNYILGLSNYLLERESKLNENAGQLIIKFIEHLPAPVCLIAHNGWQFDFPIIRRTFEKLNLEFPTSLRCVDSLRAFMEIDDKREEDICIETLTQSILNRELEVPSSKIDFEAQNNKTPDRPTLSHTEALKKRKRLYDGSDDEATVDLKDSPSTRSPEEFRSRRQLFSDLKCATTKRIPPRGVYRLGNLFAKTFGCPPVDAHQAEADVKMLTQLVQHYGADFFAFAEEQSIPFSEVVPLGGKLPNNK